MKSVRIPNEGLLLDYEYVVDTEAGDMRLRTPSFQVHSRPVSSGAM